MHENIKTLPTRSLKVMHGELSKKYVMDQKRIETKDIGEKRFMQDAGYSYVHPSQWSPGLHHTSLIPTKFFAAE
jgi:hypothetical protein